jgi:hypothetical protein
MAWSLPFLAFALPAGANIVNGGFETGAAYFPNAPNHNVSGTPAPWFATSFTPDCYDNTGVDGWGMPGIPIYNNMFQNMVAFASDRFLGFAAGGGGGIPAFNEAFAQVTTPLAGLQQYTLSAWMAVDDSGKAAPFGGPYNGRGTVDVYLDNNLIGTLSANTASLTWQPRSFTFTAPAVSTALFEFVARPEANTLLPSYMALDGIRVTLVPEPSAIGAFCAVAGALFLRRRPRG